MNPLPVWILAASSAITAPRQTETVPVMDPSPSVTDQSEEPPEQAQPAREPAPATSRAVIFTQLRADGFAAGTLRFVDTKQLISSLLKRRFPSQQASDSGEQLVLTAVATELTCARPRDTHQCRLSVTWTVSDGASGAVLYRVTTWGLSTGLAGSQIPRIGAALLQSAFDRLSARPAFQHLLEGSAGSAQKTASVDDAPDPKPSLAFEPVAGTDRITFRGLATDALVTRLLSGVEPGTRISNWLGTSSEALPSSGLTLSGKASAFTCLHLEDAYSCRLRIDWTLESAGIPVYEVTIWSAEQAVHSRHLSTMGLKLLERAVAGLTARPGFRSALALETPGAAGARPGRDEPDPVPVLAPLGFRANGSVMGLPVAGSNPELASLTDDQLDAKASEHRLGPAVTALCFGAGLLNVGTGLLLESTRYAPDSPGAEALSTMAAIALIPGVSLLVGGGAGLEATLRARRPFETELELRRSPKTALTRARLLLSPLVVRGGAGLGMSGVF